MGYSENLKAVHRNLTSNVLVSSCPFSVLNKLNIGARMTMFNYDGGVVVWSGLPYGETVKEALTKLGNDNVKWLIVPNTQHNIAIKSFKEQFPDIKILAMGDPAKNNADYTFTSEENGEKLIDRSSLEKLGITDPVLLNNFEFVYLSNHKNKDIVLYDKNSKVLCEADVLFNLEPKLEQYSPELGYAENYNPHSGWSFLTRFFHPFSMVGNYVVRERLNSGAKSAQGLQQIAKWDFETIVPCHGNVIEKNAKEAFNNLFKPVLKPASSL